MECLEVDGLDDIATLRHACSMVWALRGDFDRARELSGPDETAVDRDEPQDSAVALLSMACIAVAEGNLLQALEHSRSTIDLAGAVGIAADGIRWGWPVAARAAYDLGDAATSNELFELVEQHPAAHLPPIIRGELALAKARLVADPAGRATAVASAVGMLRNVASPYHLAQGLLDQAEAQSDCGFDEGSRLALIQEALEIGTTLGAKRVVERAQALSSASAPSPEVERTSL